MITPGSRSHKPEVQRPDPSRLLFGTGREFLLAWLAFSPTAAETKTAIKLVTERSGSSVHPLGVGVGRQKAIPILHSGCKFVGPAGDECGCLFGCPKDGLAERHATRIDPHPTYLTYLSSPTQPDPTYPTYISYPGYPTYPTYRPAYIHVMCVCLPACMLPCPPSCLPSCLPACVRARIYCDTDSRKRQCCLRGSQRVESSHDHGPVYPGTIFRAVQSICPSG